jgi:hypothetical protein
VLRLTGVHVPDYMTGKPFLGAQQDKPRNFVYGHRDRVDEVHDLARSVRNKRYLYIRNFMPHLGYNQPTFWPDQGEIRHEFYRLTDPEKMTPAQWHFAGPTRPREEMYDCQADPQNLNNLAGQAEHRAVLQKMRTELFEHIRESGDLGFLPETLAWEKSKGTTLWEMAKSDSSYRQQRLVEAAAYVGLAREKTFLMNLKNKDPGVRFWGAVGLTASDSLSPRAVQGLTAALSEGNLAAVQHAARKIELLGEQALSAVPAMQACDRRMKRIRPPDTSPFVVDPDMDSAMFVLFSTEPFLKRFAEAHAPR